MKAEGMDILLIKQSCLVNGKITGLGNVGSKLMYDIYSGKPRRGIFTQSEI